MNHLFLDLEETLITSWHDMLMIPANVEKVKQFISTSNFTQVHLFSFAIWNEKDVAKFNAVLRKPLEDALEIKISEHVISAEEVKNTVCSAKGLQFDFHEFLIVWGKVQGFADFISVTQPTGVFTLIDDVVPDRETVDFGKCGEIIRIIKHINIKSQILEQKDHQWQLMKQQPRHLKT